MSMMIRTLTVINTRLINKRVVYESALMSTEIVRFIADPDSFIADGDILKDGDTTTVVKINIDGHALVLKRYNQVGFWRSFRRAFTASRAHRCWRNALVLARLGVWTPKPYVLLEETQFWVLVRRAFLVTEYVDADTVQVQLQQPNSFTSVEQLVTAFSCLFDVMHGSKISHGDMKASNFIYRNGKLWVLDLDSMKQYKLDFLFQIRFKKDASRFMKNWRDSHLETLFRPLVGRLQNRTLVE